MFLELAFPIYVNLSNFRSIPIRVKLIWVFQLYIFTINVKTHEKKMDWDFPTEQQRSDH